MVTQPEAIEMQEAIERLAIDYGLLVFEERGFGGTMYHLVKRADADAFMLTYWEPAARFH